MQYHILKMLLCFLISVTLFFQKDQWKTKEINAKAPSDWFYLQRVFPYDQINIEAWKGFVQGIKALREQKSTTLLTQWELVGPDNIGGRISDIEMPGLDYQTIYAGTASGGIFKSTNGGSSWIPVFDDALSLSIGDIAIAQSDPAILYAGTGEANAGGGSVTYDGLGVYRSDNAGNDWNYLGLENSGSVGRIAVNPQNPDIVYVAAMGRLFSNNPERGIFKSVNGGQTWQKVLYINDSTGAVDVLVHPTQPNIVYATTWQRVRRPHRRDYGGDGSGIYKSTNAGQTWTELTNGLPAGPNIGRIGISVCRNQPEVLYAVYADRIGFFDGVYKSIDNGLSWTELNGSSLTTCFSSFGWWFGRVQADPVNPQIAYILGVTMHKTVDGGTSWFDITGQAHVDQHALHIHPVNNQFLMLGNDGGVYQSSTQGAGWNHLVNLPVTQFYTCENDNQNPNHYYGGTQDNGTIRTLSGGLSDWAEIYGGDGFRVTVDPVNNQNIYAEYQYGGFSKSTNGGISFLPATWGMNGSDRYNWNCPYVLDPQNPAILYFGSNIIYKSTDFADSWTPVSPDLSNGPGFGGVVYGTVTTISVSPLNQNVVWAGTDDGNIWISQNAGNAWLQVNNGLPVRYITSVAADPVNPAKAWLTLSGFRYDEYLPHVFMTEDYGQTWQDRSGNLPDIPVNKIVIQPGSTGNLFLATDGGVFYSNDQGFSWTFMNNGLPNVPVIDLKFHAGSNTLIAATYGRSMYRMNMDNFPGLDDHKPMSGILISQVNNCIIISGAEKDAKIDLFNMEGKRITSARIPSGNTSFKMELPTVSGVYIVSCLSSNQTTSRKLFVK